MKFLVAEPSNNSVQTRSSSRLKQKSNVNADVHSPSTPSLDTSSLATKGAAPRIKRHLSTEFMSTSTAEHATSTVDDLFPSEYRFRSASAIQDHSDNHCQTTDDLLELVHRSIQTNQLIKSNKSTYTDFIDRPLCENSTQTAQKEEQETQTTDLNFPNDSHVYLYDLKHSQSQCDDISEGCSTSSSPRASSPITPSCSQPLQQQQQQQQARLSSPYVDFSLTNSNHDRLQIFQGLIHTEEHPNGGASLIRTYYNEFLRLSHENAHLFVNYFFNLVYGEMNQRAKYSIGVLHDGARYLPDLVEYFSLTYPKMTVKTSNIINSKEVLTTTMGEYRNRLVQTYCNGTFRYGPLMSISLVGKVTGKEECGKHNHS